MKCEFTPALRIATLVVLMTLLLLGMIGRKQWTLSMGTRVMLETQPIDPRSLFRGDYVRLNYTIQSFDINAYPHLAAVKRGDVIFVVLKKGEPYWQVADISSVWPEQGGVVLRGEVERNSMGTIRVSYGIESYFVPEGEGRTLERPAADEKVSIEVAVDSWGKAAIHSVRINGTVRYVETLF